MRDLGYGTVKQIYLDPVYLHIVRQTDESVRRLYGDAGNSGNGVFMISKTTDFLENSTLRVIASNGGGWDQVSVSRPDRCPSWDDMCVVKALFFEVSECVVQYHPPQKLYVNAHPYCLHLWRPQDVDMPMPPTAMVGPRDGQSQESLKREADAL